MRWGQVELKNENDSVKKIKKDLEARKKRARRRRRKIIFIRILLIVFFAGIIYGLYQFDQSKYSRVAYVVVKGNEVISDDVIKKTVNVKENDRLYLMMQKSLERKLNSHQLIEDVHVKVDRKQRLVLIAVDEKKALAHDKTFTYFTDDVKIENTEIEQGLLSIPTMVDITDETIIKKTVENLAEVDRASLLAVSEIYHKPTDLDKEYLELVMNQGYFVYTSINTLPLLNNYATIISGADPKNRCIYILEYGPTKDTHVATAKPCE